MNIRTTQRVLPSDIKLRSENMMDDYLTTDALRFLYLLHNKFNHRRRALLTAREQRQKKFNAGECPQFPTDSEYIKSSRWKVAPVHKDLHTRVLEFVGPVNHTLNNQHKMDAFVVDLEDATVPEWKNIITAQKHLRDGVAGLNELSEIPIIGLKPRALTGSDNNILIGDEPISSSLLDFGLFFFHNASRLLDKGSTPYLLLPKIESNCEARWWNQVFTFAQYHLGIPQGTIKASIAIDNILAGFQLHEILYELRDHAAGMTFEPFNYLQSIIRKFPYSMVLPSYRSLSVESAGLNAVRHLLIDTCRLRKSYALGLPMDMQQVNIDILAGYNGLRLTNTDFIEEILTLIQERDEEEIIRMEEYKVTDTDLLSFPKHPVSLEDFRANIRMSLIYLCEVHAGRGSTDVDGQQIDRSLAGLMIGQLWQWLHNTQKLETGEVVTRNLYQDILTSELEEIRAASGPGMDECLTSAVQQLDKLIVEKQFMDIYPAK